MTDSQETEYSAGVTDKPLTPRQNARAVGGNDVRRVTEEGREYLVFPIVTAREMVLNYPENGTKELLPADSLRETVDMWAGTPLTYMHPENQQKTAAVPEAYTKETIGQVHNPAIVGGEKLRVEGWLDVEKANAIGGLAQEVVNKLKRGDEVATSPGYRTLGDQRVNGTHDGEEYDLEQGTVIPNHVAIFPDDAFNARCPPGEGCAAPRANATPADSDAAPGAEGTDTMTDNEIETPSAETVGDRMLRLLGFGDESEQVTHNHADGDCACGGDDAATCECEGEPRANADEGDDPEDPDTDTEAEADEQTDSPDEPTTDQTDMSNEDHSERVERLAEESPFDADTLAAMTDEQIEAISGDADTSEEPAEPEQAETTESPEGTESTGDAETEEVTVNNELKEQVEALTETVEELRADKQNAEKRDDARVVANALEIEMDDAMEMERERLNHLAEEYGDRAEETEERARTNFGAVPGDFERDVTTNSEEEYDHISAGTRSAYDEQNGGDN